MSANAQIQLNPARVQIFVPAPEVRKGSPWLSTNRRDHYHARAALVRTWRALALAGAKKLGRDKMTEPVCAHAQIHFTDNRARDLDGAVPTVKACLDGVVDSGLIEDDNRRILVSLLITSAPGKYDRGGVLLDIGPVCDNCTSSIAGLRDIKPTTAADITRAADDDADHVRSVFPATRATRKT